MDDETPNTASILPDSDAIAELDKQTKSLLPDDNIAKNKIIKKSTPSYMSAKSFDIIKPRVDKSAQKVKIGAVSTPMTEVEDNDEVKSADTSKEDLSPMDATESFGSKKNEPPESTFDEDYSEPLPGFIDIKEDETEEQANPPLSDSPQTSFATQIQQSSEQSKPDQELNYHDPFDIKEYHQPLLPAHTATKKKHTALWITFAIVLAVAVIGIIFLLRRSGLI